MNFVEPCSTEYHNTYACGLTLLARQTHNVQLSSLSPRGTVKACKTTCADYTPALIPEFETINTKQINAFYNGEQEDYPLREFAYNKYDDGCYYVARVFFEGRAQSDLLPAVILEQKTLFMLLNKTDGVKMEL